MDSLNWDLSIKYTLDFEDLVPPKTKYFSNFYIDYMFK